MSWISYFFSRKSPPTLTRKYGWRRDTHDTLDHMITFSSQASLPEQVDLRSKCPPIWDQETIGCCTAESVSGAYMYDELEGDVSDPFTPSILFLYYNTRKSEHTADTDSGATIRDTVKCLAKVGICSSKAWPFDPDKFADEPPTQCYEDAEGHKALAYKRVQQTESQLEGCLASGHPICFGVLVYSSFEDREVARTGVIPLPDTERESLLGGHAILLVGYDSVKRVFTFRNSWGKSWGADGYGYLPYEYVLSRQLSSDFWVVLKVD